MSGLLKCDGLEDVSRYRPMAAPLYSVRRTELRVGDDLLLDGCVTPARLNQLLSEWIMNAIIEPVRVFTITYTVAGGVNHPVKEKTEVPWYHQFRGRYAHS